MHGTGIYLWKDGRKYDGEYINDKVDLLLCKRNMGLGFIHLRMAGGMRVNGEKESKVINYIIGNMVKENISKQTVGYGKGSGKMVNV